MEAVVCLRISTCLVIEILLLIPIFLAGIPAYFMVPNQYPQSTPRPLVVLIHGARINDLQWVWAKSYLYGHHVPYISVNYNTHQNISESVNQVYRQIQDHNRELILIGQSMGGLIARSLAPMVNCKKLIMLHSPQRGSHLISWLHSEDTPIHHHEMMWDSDYIRSLPKIDPNKVIEVVGINDFVRPFESIAFNKTVYYSWFGHYFSAVNPYLWHYLIPLLK